MLHWPGVLRGLTVWHEATVLPGVMTQALSAPDVVVPAAVPAVAEHGGAEAQLLLVVTREPGPEQTFRNEIFISRE